MRLGVTGVYPHHHLALLVHLVVHLDQADFGDATGMEELPRDDWWIFSPFCHHTLNRMMHPEVHIALWFLLRVCRCGDKRVRVTTRASLALRQISACFRGGCG